MKISRYIKVSEEVKWKKVILKSMKYHHYGKNLYILCTGTKPGYLFEILPSKFLTSAYNQSYAIAVTKTREEAIDYLKGFAEEIYIKGTMTLDQLKETKEGA